MVLVAKVVQLRIECLDSIGDGEKEKLATLTRKSIRRAGT